MADWYENERMWSLTNTADVTIDTDAAALVTDGGTALDFHTTASVASATGSVFTCILAPLTIVLIPVPDIHNSPMAVTLPFSYCQAGI